jgi:type III restriction enzyme
MHILKEYQGKAVEMLIEYTCDALQMPNRKIQMLLKAPTGAGKTVTMAAYLSQLVQEVALRPNLPRDIAFIWLAPNTLHLQSYTSLKGFYSELNDLKPLQIEDLSGETELQAKDLLFINWSSVDKEKNTFRRDNEQNYNLQTFVERTIARGTEIIVIIDEAHLSAFTGEQAKMVLKMINAKIEISVTATPKTQPDMSVVIQRQKVVAAQMIKKGVRLNIDLSETEQRGQMLEMHLLRKAMQKREDIAKAYNEAGIDINPLLLIQLPSEKVTLTDEDRNLRDYMEGFLDSDYGINTQNNKLSVWLSDSKDKINLDDIEKPNAMQKVLIFKQAISQGWDCPRAAVLIIFREIGNPTFGIQTVGRILRMPQQKHYENELINFGYVYTNLQNKIIKIVADDLDYFSMQIGKRKDCFFYDFLTTAFRVNDRAAPGYLLSSYERIFFRKVEERYGVKQIPEQTLFNQEEEDAIRLQKNANRSVFESQMWNLNVHEIEISVAVDITIDAYEVNAIVVDGDHLMHFAKTQAELSEMFDRFCYNSITRLNRSKSWKTMRNTLIRFMEYYLGYLEFETRKLLLCGDNQVRLIELINDSLESYDIWQKEQGGKSRLEVSQWEVPEERDYPEIYRKNEAVEFHALVPFYESGSASAPEKTFVLELEKQSCYIDWWYKNGDKGKEHFAIPYEDLRKEDSLFYVDFIVKFKSGITALFDTKSKDSDPEAPNKHKALLAYCERENKKRTDMKLMGSVIIPDEIANVLTWRYCTNKIENTHDLKGWDFFNPATINNN